MRSNKVSRRQIMKDKRAASPAISMVIITAATVVLVLVAGGFAVQVLNRQQATTEFNSVQKSILAFDDAVRDVAWKEGASRSVRFATNHGSFQVISDTKSFEITAFNGNFQHSFDTAVIKYIMPDSQLTLGKGYSSYILGNELSVVSSVSDSLGQVLVAQESGFASISLSYRVRVSSEGPARIVDSKPTNYVDILIIKLSSVDLFIDTGDFDLVAKNIGRTTETSMPIEVTSAGVYFIEVASGEFTNTIPMQLDAGQVIFNVIIGEVRVST
jgi:hypothetical protein